MEAVSIGGFVRWWSCGYRLVGAGIKRPQVLEQLCVQLEYLGHVAKERGVLRGRQDAPRSLTLQPLSPLPAVRERG